MDLLTLKNKLLENNVPAGWYSLDDGLKPDAIIIYKNYSRWECFYLDEKGQKLNYEEFSNENDAYEYLWKKIEELLQFYKKKE